MSGIRSRPRYDVAAYIWPAYHDEPRLARWWPEGDGEWYTVRRATPRFPGHDMPRIPLLGCQDEADPAVMRHHIELAREHGINVFIMDWYWYEQAPCFERQLNEGLLPALEGTDMRFYLMWANHDASSLWDMHTDAHDVLWSGQVDRAALEPMFERVIERYLTHDRYYRIDGKPVFSLFQFPNFAAGLGGLDPANDALGWMRRRCVAHGLPGLHLQAIGNKGAGGVEDGVRLEETEAHRVAAGLDMDSAASYQYRMDSDPDGDYVAWAAKAMQAWPYYEQTYGTYFPHVSIGWDNTPRVPSERKAVTGATPDAFEAHLWKAKAWLDARPRMPPLVTINSWNEWTEGSYLLPDMRWGYCYLRAVRNVFGGV
ncbi:MAG: glycoside hydrolase family 99-like domain-containing protein [Kiritimatiellae bacterium]|nr:glycoside hydrolase family 99-like domain-containing protein [Kiritimatiellia bacterium]